MEATPSWIEDAPFGRPERGWQRKLYEVIFESDTHAGRTFDLVLIAAIVASVTVVMLDSVESLGKRYPREFNTVELGFTFLFTIEYVLRLCAVQRPIRYATSFFGIVDLLAVLPTYMAIFVPEASALLSIRLLRLLRIFRILKLTAYVEEYRYLGRAFRASARKIIVFLVTVVMIVLVSGTLVYLVEGPENGFTSIPVAVYWAVTTVTTVGFGDIVPQTGFGRFVAALMMLLGWGMVAVPTGIVTAEMTRGRWDLERARTCPSCGTLGHDLAARFCKDCGKPL